MCHNAFIECPDPEDQNRGLQFDHVLDIDHLLHLVLHILPADLQRIGKDMFEESLHSKQI